MFTKNLLLAFLGIIIFVSPSFSQTKKHPISIKMTIDDKVKSDVKPDGRLILFLTTDTRGEPRTLQEIIFLQ